MEKCGLRCVVCCRWWLFLDSWCWLHCTTLHDKVSTASSCRVYTCRWWSKLTSLRMWAATLVRFRRCSFYRSWKTISMLWVLLRTAKIQMTEWLLLWWIFSWPVVLLWVCDFDCFDPWRMTTHKCSKRFCNYGSPTLFYLQSVVFQHSCASAISSISLHTILPPLLRTTNAVLVLS